MFEGMGVSVQQLGPQRIYFDILLFGSIVTLLRCTFSSFFSGIGRTNIVMLSSLSALIVNALLGYIFIFGKLGLPPLGIHGAAYAAIAGGTCGLLILAGAYLHQRMREEFKVLASLRFDPVVTWTLLRFGSSTGLELFLNIVAFNAVVMTFHAHSAVTATAATIMFNWDMVSFVPLLGIEIAVTSMVGRFMGAGLPETAHRSVMSALKLGIAYSAFILVLFVGFPHYLVNIFYPQGDPGLFLAASPLALYMLRLASLYVMLESVLTVFIGALRGAGDTFWAMCLSVGAHWAMVVAIVIILRVLHLSPQVGWAFLVGIFLLLSLIVYLRYQSGHWKKITMVRNERPAILPDSFHEPVDV
jgi:MATE family multidrug resistance protein